MQASQQPSWLPALSTQPCDATSQSRPVTERVTVMAAPRHASDAELFMVTAFVRTTPVAVWLAVIELGRPLGEDATVKSEFPQPSLSVETEPERPVSVIVRA